jgi:hypothetical protein
MIPYVGFGKCSVSGCTRQSVARIAHTPLCHEHILEQFHQTEDSENEPYDEEFAKVLENENERRRREND